MLRISSLYLVRQLLITLYMVWEKIEKRKEERANVSDERDKVVQEMAMVLKKRLIFVLQILYKIELQNDR